MGRRAAPIVLALGLAALSGCAGQPEAAREAENRPPTMRTMDAARDTSNRASLPDRVVAERFIEVFYNQNQLVEGFALWVHPDYIQHDPNSPTGRDPTIAILRAHMAANPQMSHEVKRVIHGDEGPDGTLVAVHYHFRRAPGDRGSAVVDLFRIKDGYLVEHWDVIQPVPPTALNDNTMF